MPAPYSYDLRKKAIEAVSRGQRKTEVCRILQISRNTLVVYQESYDRFIEGYNRWNLILASDGRKAPIGFSFLLITFFFPSLNFLV